MVDCPSTTQVYDILTESNPPLWKEVDMHTCSRTSRKSQNYCITVNPLDKHQILTTGKVITSSYTNTGHVDGHHSIR